MELTRSFFFISMIAASLFIGFSGEVLLALFVILTDIVLIFFVFHKNYSRFDKQKRSSAFLVIFSFMVILIHLLFRGQMGWLDYFQRQPYAENLFSSKSEFVFIFIFLMLMSSVLYKKVRNING